jgi:hypothetical protein
MMTDYPWSVHLRVIELKAQAIATRLQRMTETNTLSKAQLAEMRSEIQAALSEVETHMFSDKEALMKQGLVSLLSYIEQRRPQLRWP